jgi:hypothetical protein
MNFVLNPCSGVATQAELNLSWKFNNIQNDTESKFIVEADDNNHFNSPKFSTTVTPSGITSGGSNAQVISINVSTNNNPCTQVGGTTCYLHYGRSYFWRVRVCETTRSGSELCSEDASHNPVWYYYNVPNGGITDYHSATAVAMPAKPNPLPSFTRSILSPMVNDTVTFTDSSSCYDANGTRSDCKDSSTSGYTWKFGTAGTNNVKGNTSWKFTSPGSPVVELKVCDPASTPTSCCTATQQFDVSSPRNTTTPNYKEVPPF